MRRVERLCAVSTDKPTVKCSLLMLFRKFSWRRASAFRFRSLHSRKRMEIFGRSTSYPRNEQLAMLLLRKTILYVNAINSRVQCCVSVLSFVAAAQAIKPNLLRENKSFAQKLMQQHLVFGLWWEGKTDAQKLIASWLAASVGMPSILGILLSSQKQTHSMSALAPTKLNPVKFYFDFSSGIATILLGRRTKDALCSAFVSFRFDNTF